MQRPSKPRIALLGCQRADREGRTFHWGIKYFPSLPLVSKSLLEYGDGVKHEE